MSNSGSIYIIVNTDSGKVYVGATIQDVAQRWRCHQAGCHRRASALWRDMDDMGVHCFEIRVVERNVEPDRLGEREQYWINKLNALSPTGYNTQTGGRDGFVGWKYTPEQKEARRRERSRQVTVVDSATNERRIFASRLTAAQFFGVGRTRISNHLHSGRRLFRNRWIILDTHHG